MDDQIIFTQRVRNRLDLIECETAIAPEKCGDTWMECDGVGLTDHDSIIMMAVPPSVCERMCLSIQVGLDIRPFLIYFFGFRYDGRLCLFESIL